MHNINLWSLDFKQTKWVHELKQSVSNLKKTGRSWMVFMSVFFVHVVLQAVLVIGGIVISI